MTTLLTRRPRNPFNNMLTSEMVNPFSNIFDDMIKDAFPEFYKKSGISFIKGSYPKVNIIEFEDKAVIEAEIPGLTKEDISIKVTKKDKDNILTISGQKQDRNFEEGDITYCELKHSAFSRSFQLNDNIDCTKIDAEFKNGILDITLKKITPEKIEDNEQEIKIK